jgi:uncharacterized protein with FMN-binding domain
LRRVLTVLIATIGGIALLASFHTTPGIATRTGARGRNALRPPAGGTPPANDSTSSPSTSTPGSAPPGTAPPATSPRTASAASRTIVGPVSSNFYGDVQVEIVVKGGQLIDVEAVQLPSDRRRSQEINSIAGPDLRQEALQAKSANIDVISGATYTSYSYAQSLQAALDQAGL